MASLNEQERDFIRRHLDSDLKALALAAHRYKGITVSTLIPRIAALRKLREKAPSLFRLDLEIPSLLSVEQASSEVVARFKTSLFSGKHLLDLTGGLGIDAYFWSKRFEEVTYVEREPLLSQAARHNFARLSATNIQVITAEAEDFLKKSSQTFDLIYLDPDRRNPSQRRLFRLEDCSPNVIALHKLLLSHAPKMLIKASPMLDLTQAQQRLPQIEHIWVESWKGEVREVLLLAGHSSVNADEVPIEATILSGESVQTFQFTRAEEHSCLPQLSEPLRYLYEPDPSILKAGAFKVFAKRFGLSKLHLHAHLYTADALELNLPAKIFAVEAVFKYDRKVARQFLPERRANVVVRHFPDSPDQVRQRLGLAEGGDKYLFATTAKDGRKILILCIRLDSSSRKMA
ncbi:MAG: class I SAM-dependent methyltransferase [Saprospiraceae bacterium]|nr:class I SAM-dependent methyltransferase [Saprospiraceae bacterium]MDW8483741.1 RsmD family RNA methyltransferase [Saprospiraceae bacterium]